MESIQGILNPGKTIDTCKPCSDPSKLRNKFGIYHTGVNYNLAPSEKKYNCPICEDREIVSAGLNEHGLPLFKECTCKVKNTAAKKLRSSGLNEQQLKYTLEDYQLNDGNRKMFEGVKRYLSVWPDLINSDSTSKGFFLVGNVGIGKTMLSCIIARDMLNKGVSVVFVSSTDLLAELKQAQFSKNEHGIEAKIDTLAKVPALILDDIGKEKPTEWVQSMYYRLIDLRYRNNTLTGFTSNYYPQSLDERLGDFGEATVSRILSMTKEYFLFAKDRDHRIEGNT